MSDIYVMIWENLGFENWGFEQWNFASIWVTKL